MSNALLMRYVYCVKPGSNGCVNDDDAISADAGWMHWCPGCNDTHAIAVEHPHPSGARWTFDGNHDRPTFAPSVKITVGPRPSVPVGRPDAGKIDVCHYVIRDGQIEFCGDSTHALAGKTVPLPPLPPDAA